MAAAEAGRVFIGDDAGVLHCLDVTNARQIWKTYTSRRKEELVGIPWLRDGLIYSMLGVTLLSGAQYLWRAVWILRTANV